MRQSGRPDTISVLWSNVTADGGDTSPGSWGAVLCNDSDAPIRYAHLTVRHRRDSWVSKVGFHKVAAHCKIKWSADKVYAAAQGGFGPSKGIRQQRFRESWSDTSLFSTELTFQDRIGRFWLIDEDDELHELSRELVIWTDKERAAACERHIATEFQPKFGVNVRVEPFLSVEEVQKQFNEQRRRPTLGRARPDVLVGPHDWLGKLQEQEAVSEVPLTVQQRASFEDAAIRALTRGSCLLGVPYAFDAVALVRNLDLTGDAPPPTTFEELLETGDRLRLPEGRVLALQVGSGDIFHLWPIFSSVGGTVAGLQPDGTFAPRHEWAEGMIEAFQALAALATRRPDLFDIQMTRDSAIDLFRTGTTPYLIAACGRVGELQSSGMRIDASAVPQSGPYPARSMISVHAFFLPRQARNERIAQDLLTHYLARPSTAIELNRIQPWPPVQREAVDEVMVEHPCLHAYLEAVREGVIMPSHPRIRDGWTALHEAELAILRGNRDVTDVANAVIAALDALRLPEDR